MKKVRKILLAVLLAFSFYVGVTPIKAARVTLQYFDTQAHTFAGNASTIYKVTDGLSQIRDVQSFSFVTRYTTNSTSASEIHSLFFVGKENVSNDYVNIYLKPVQGNGSRLGVELRNRSQNKSYSVDVKRLNDNRPHSIAFTIEEGRGYVFYVDGEVVKVVNEEHTRFITGSISDPSYFSFGGGYRGGSANSYYAKGEMKNARLYITTLTPEEVNEEHFNDSVGANPIFTKKSKEINSLQQEEEVTFASNATSFSLDATFRFNNESRFNLFTLEGNNKVNAFIDTTTNKVGLKIGETDYAISLQNGLINTNKWYSIAYVVDKTVNKLKVYVDKVLVGELENVPGLNEIGTLNKARVGSNSEAEQFNGSIERAYVYSTALNETAIEALHSTTDYVFEQIVDPTNSYESETINLFENGYLNSRKYRIPSLLTTTSGTLLAAIDQRHQHYADWGNIDTFLRRSTDGGKTWDEGKRVIDLIDDEAAGQAHSAFLIDPSMVQDRSNGRIFMLVDMFTDNRSSDSRGGFFGLDELGSGFVEINGKKYLKLLDADGNEYTVRENGEVFNQNNEKTAYTVPDNATFDNAFKDLGTLYQNGEVVGNIFQMNSPLSMVPTSYLWLTHSDDDGLTWSKPVNINGQVKKEWMKFLGTGPGVGIQTQSGRLVFPVYHTNANGGSQSSAVIYSDDNGENWTISESVNDGRLDNNGGSLSAETLSNSLYETTESQVIQLNNGELKLFMRNNYTGSKLLVATSHDEGATWSDTFEQFDDVLEPYCQLSVIHYGEHEGKELIIFSNPSNSRGNRSNGKLRIGEVTNGNIQFTHSQVVEKGQYAYSSIAKLPNGNIGILYEAEDLDIRYREVDLNWIKAPLVNKPASAPQLIGYTARVERSKIKISVRFNQKVLVGSDNVRLPLSLEGFEETARYVGGSGTNTLTFEYDIKGDEFGILSANAQLEGIVEGAFKHPISIRIDTIHDFDIIPPANYVVSSNNSDSREPVGNAFDGSLSTLWHSKWDKTGATPHELLIDLQTVEPIVKLVYIPRQSGENGIITKYRIETSTDNATYTEVASGDLEANKFTKVIEIPVTEARYVKLVSLEGVGGYSSAAEVYVVREMNVTRQADKTALIQRFEALKATKKANYTKETFDYLVEALNAANEFIEAEGLTQNEVNEMLSMLNEAYDSLENRAVVEKSSNNVRVKYLAETFEVEDFGFNVEYMKESNIKDVFNVSFTKDGNNILPSSQDKIEILLPKKANQEIAKIEYSENGDLVAVKNYKVEDDMIIFEIGTSHNFVVTYYPEKLDLTKFVEQSGRFNQLNQDEYEAGYEVLEAKFNEINAKIQDMLNPLSQIELDGLVNELQPLFEALTKRENIKPIQMELSTTDKGVVDTSSHNYNIELIMLLISAVVLIRFTKNSK